MCSGLCVGMCLPDGSACCSFDFYVLQTGWLTAEQGDTRAVGGAPGPGHGFRASDRRESQLIIIFSGVPA